MKVQITPTELETRWTEFSKEKLAKMGLQLFTLTKPVNETDARSGMLLTGLTMEGDDTHLNFSLAHLNPIDTGFEYFHVTIVGSNRSRKTAKKIQLYFMIAAGSRQDAIKIDQVTRVPMDDNGKVKMKPVVSGEFTDLVTLKTEVVKLLNWLFKGKQITA